MRTRRPVSVGWAAGYRPLKRTSRRYLRRYYTVQPTGKKKKAETLYGPTDTRLQLRIWRGKMHATEPSIKRARSQTARITTKYSSVQRAAGLTGGQSSQYFLSPSRSSRLARGSSNPEVHSSPTSPPPSTLKPTTAPRISDST